MVEFQLKTQKQQYQVTKNQHFEYMVILKELRAQYNLEYQQLNKFMREIELSQHCQSHQ